MNRNYSKGYLNKSHFTGGLLLSVAMLISSCSNTTPLNENNCTVAPTQMTPAKSATSIAIDWQNVESQADRFYKSHPEYAVKSPSNSDVVNNTPSRISPVEKAYAKSFGVSVSEAQKRLVLQSSSQGVIEAIKDVLGDAFVEAYYINDHPDGFRLGVTTTHAIKASSYGYTFKQAGFEGLILPIYIYPISDKTRAQIFALQEKATPEILKRYPDTQSIGFSPMTNTISVSIYRKNMSETERERIEAELTELVGHAVKVEILKNPITAL